MMVFCNIGTSSGAHSTPRSPLATTVRVRRCLFVVVAGDRCGGRRDATRYLLLVEDKRSNVYTVERSHMQGSSRAVRAVIIGGVLTYAIGELDDLGEGIAHEATGFLDLRHYVGRERVRGIVFHDQSLDLDNVLRTLDEAQRDPIDSNTEHVLEILAILRGEAAYLEDGIGGVDPLDGWMDGWMGGWMDGWKKEGFG